MVFPQAAQQRGPELGCQAYNPLEKYYFLGWQLKILDDVNSNHNADDDNDDNHDNHDNHVDNNDDKNYDDDNDDYDNLDDNNNHDENDNHDDNNNEDDVDDDDDEVVPCFGEKTLLIFF